MANNALMPLANRLAVFHRLDTQTKGYTVWIYSMPDPTRRQQQILDFIQKVHRSTGVGPTHQEIADHFGFRSPNAVTAHLRLLRNKGVLTSEPAKARSLRVVSPLEALRKPIVDIPLFGSIPAGFAENRQQEAIGCVSVDIGTIGIKPTTRTFALEVRGDSMIGKHIMPGDIVVLEHGMTPKPGDVVAALIEGESTLKTFMTQRGKAFLHAENPKYPDLTPASELVIQGIMIALLRKTK
jgi:repressor LexA